MINLLIILGFVIILFMIIGEIVLTNYGEIFFFLMTILLALSIAIGMGIFSICSDEQFIDDSIETSSIQLDDIKFSDDYRTVSALYFENESLKILPINSEDCTIKKGTKLELIIEKHNYKMQKVWGEFYMPNYENSTKVTYTIICDGEFPSLSS